MKLTLAFFLTVLIFFQHCLSDSPSKNGSKSIDHEAWTELLKKHVNSEGFVDYGGFKKDRLKLNAYLEVLRKNPPDETTWTQEEQIAYWINTYNAFTVKLIIDHYPIESIKDIGSTIQIPFINSPWDIKFIEINNQKLDLNNIEHAILRKKFDEPRIHFAINCASVSCPKLRREAFVAEKLNDQLREQAYEFINDPKRNLISEQTVELSKIFRWFKGDFTKNQTLKAYVNQYANSKIREESNISFMDYDWSLNVVH